MKCPECGGEPEYVEVALDDGTRSFEDCWVRASYKDGKFTFDFHSKYDAYYEKFNMQYQYDMITGRLEKGRKEEVVCPLCREDIQLDKDGILHHLQWD